MEKKCMRENVHVQRTIEETLRTNERFFLDTIENNLEATEEKSESDDR